MPLALDEDYTVSLRVLHNRLGLRIDLLRGLIGGGG